MLLMFCKGIFTPSEGPGDINIPSLLTILSVDIIIILYILHPITSISICELASMEKHSCFVDLF